MSRRPPTPGRQVTQELVFVRFAQKAFVVSQRRLLMVRRDQTDPRHPGLWEVPGGRMQVGEGLDEHIRREVWEETGVVVEPGAPFRLWQWSMSEDSTGSPANACDEVWVVAVARRCAPTSVELATSNRSPGDHLAEVDWVPVAEIGRYEIIPDLEPAMRDFLAAYRDEHPDG